MSSVWDWVNIFHKDIDTLPPYQVAAVKPENYVHYDVIAREDPVVLYSHFTADHEIMYELVVHKDLHIKTAYSLMRSKSATDIDRYFNSLSQKLPQILTISPHITVEMLQEICNYDKEHQNQSLAHICAYYSQLNDYFNQLTPNDTAIINCRSPGSGRTPLHIAVLTGRVSTVQKLLSLSPNLEIVDRNDNNVLHVAANTTKEIIEKICLAAKTTTSDVNLISLINVRNNDNFTPLYIACYNDKPDCVKELLKNGADVNSASIIDQSDSEMVDHKIDDDKLISDLETKDMKNGGTPLHWTSNEEVMEILIEKGCHVDGRDFQGQTALHVKVARSELSGVIILLSYGADVSIKGLNGNTPLHLAVKSELLAMVQALIVFGADVNAKNSNGETARHLAAAGKRSSEMDLILYVLHSVGAKRCSTNRSDCTDGCSQSSGSQFNGSPPDNSPFKRIAKFYDNLLGELIVKKAVKRKQENSSSDRQSTTTANRCRVLCLDGGGVRGLIIIQMLWALETMAKRKMNEMFDWMSGTSTGGILALLLALGNSTDDCRRLYFRLKDKVFVGLMRPYASAPLEKFLKQALGEDTRMGDIEKPRVMVTATIGDRFPPGLHLFRNYDSPANIYCNTDGHNVKEVIPSVPNPLDEHVWKVGRSSGAAPTYFRPCDSYIDGGLIANNPTLDTLTEICSLNKALTAVNRESETLDLDVVVSLGTGSIPEEVVPIIDICRPESWHDIATSVVSAKILVKLLIEQASQSDGQVVERAKAWCSQTDVPYFRMNPPLSEDIELNETDNTKLVNMLWETTAYMFSRYNELEELVILLS
ncbi:85/88 kDa calcium-independent phospholipase A2-like [Oppia nitens]|uniref:85/88 kDa calcium-independent phospholipase A2-like n=1 Tax=Oppia nitens TaxID=1686743 RepID=UPI0023DC6055|nr:85/88 kDa calcium-independent phospholipase A2-like [Oppia nitens]